MFLIGKNWSPALRTGTGWNEYLVFDFGVIARLNQVKVVSTEDLRKVVRVKIEVTNSLPYFNYVTEKGIPPDQIVTLDSAVQARYAKLTVIAEAEKNPGVLPIGLSKYVVVLCVFTTIFRTYFTIKGP